MKRKYLSLLLLILLTVGCKQKVEVPTVLTAKVQFVEYAEATAGGEVVDEGSSVVTACGVCWSTSHNPIITNSKTNEPTDTRFYVSKLTGLKPNTTYYVRAYAMNNDGVGYGEEVSFTTKELVRSVIDISSPENITSGYVERIQAEIVETGGSDITACGFVWAFKREPTLDDYSIQASLTGSRFSSKIDNLMPDSTYYLRAYAKNSLGVAYSTKYFEIKTLSVATQLLILGVDSVSYDYATVQVEAVSADRANLIEEVGLYWSYLADDLSKDNKLVAIKAEDQHEYLIFMTALEADTTYYLTPYAKNKYGEKLGDSFQLKTLVKDDDDDNTYVEAGNPEDD